jgi:RecA/RadA recombinase
MAQRIRSRDVFTPGSFPTHTYIERTDTRLDDQLRQGLETQGMIVSVAGPSKSGKTVLVERLVGENLVPVTGATIRDPEDVWARALDWMGLPSETSKSDGTSHKGAMTAGVKGGASLFGIGKAEVSGSGTLESGGSASTGEVTRRRGMKQVVDEIGDSDFVLLLDDFHYIPREIQVAVAQQLKEAARLKVRIVVAAVPHRSDDVIRANPDLRGRVLSVDLAYWQPSDLERIARVGFEKLEVEVDGASLAAFAIEAAGSPQLMQAICLNTCWVLDIDAPAGRRQFTLDEATRRRIFERTALATDYRTLVGMLQKGPKTRGTDRNAYQFAEGGEGDVYICILRAVAADPPRLSFHYDEIIGRVERLCGSNAKPVGSSIAGSLFHMSKISRDTAARVFDWDEGKGVLDIPDPYLVFYLRWSGLFGGGG